MRSPKTLAGMFSTKNVGPIDRLLRVIPAIVATVLIIQGLVSGVVAWITGALAAMLLVTAILGSCSIYYLFGFSSCRTHQSKS